MFVQLSRGFISSAGCASRVGSSTLAEAEGGTGGKAGSPASKERERDPEEGNQKGETETQGNLQGPISSKQALHFRVGCCIFIAPLLTELELLC